MHWGPANCMAEPRALTEYYRERRRGVASEVGRVFVLSRPMTLSEVTRNGTPPQSFTYLSGRAVKKLVRGADERRDGESGKI